MNYANGKIYKIWNDVNDKLYVGSTTQPLYKRFSGHKAKSNSGSTYLLHQAMREHGYECFHIELVREYPCKNREQLLRKEGRYIRKFRSHRDGYNKCVAGRHVRRAIRHTTKTIEIQY
jgi:group I intron endonuclease